MLSMDAPQLSKLDLELHAMRFKNLHWCRKQSVDSILQTLGSEEAEEGVRIVISGL